MLSIAIAILIAGATAFRMTTDHKGHMGLHHLLKGTEGFEVERIVKNKRGDSVIKYADGCSEKVKEAP